MLQLESERLLAEGIAHGIVEGGLSMLVALVNEGTITIPAAAEKAQMTEAEFIQLMKEKE